MAVIEAIATTYLEADAASVEFTSIPATYEHLELRFPARGTDTTAATYYTSLNLQFGTGGGAVDTGANYSRHYMLQAGLVAGGNAGINQIWLGTIENAGSGTGTEHVGRYAAGQAEIVDERLLRVAQEGGEVAEEAEVLFRTTHNKGRKAFAIVEEELTRRTRRRSQRCSSCSRSG